MKSSDLLDQVTAVLKAQPITDMHTHCYAPRFGASPGDGAFLLWGIDELLTYHYLVAEVYRVVPPEKFPYEKFWSLGKAGQADHIWQHLFVERTPMSEACRGVITTLSLLGLDPGEKDLTSYRRWFSEQDPDGHVDRVMELSGVDSLTMTNEVFNDHERGLWLSDPGLGGDPRFRAVLRIDPLLINWSGAAGKLASWGFRVAEDFSGNTIEEGQRFLREWIHRMKAAYVAVSLPPGFRYPDPQHGPAERVMAEIVLTTLREEGIPLAMMIGSVRQVNPELKDAGDMSGLADMTSVTSLCREFSGNHFLVTMLSRENQHELCVAARKFPNLMVFGCWWFLNNPSLIEEVTRMRLELLGTSFIPQHSDARILDQLIYKWDHFRRILATVLADKYRDLEIAGYTPTRESIEKDAALLLRDNFRTFTKN